jgi:leukotriene-A4 hydrolase
MSALQKGDGRAASSSTTTKETGMKEFTWEQPVACSSYLIAIAVGDLEKVEISSRCRVWSEPSMVAEASDEFSQTEDFLKAAEKLAGPYRWTRYDLLCLPPSFPYGGMENPCLTFVTPTLLAGDKSLADVVAHEIAHSWTGNLVTNATWTHFWLNEGWTRWFELSIMAEIQGDDRYFDLRASLGYEGLKDDVQRYLEAGEPEMTCLVPPLEGIDPDDSFSSVPYERGMNFLFYLQRKVGKAAFQSFFKAYVLEYASKTITSHGFRLFFESHFAANPNAKGVDWETWLVSPGMLPEEPVYDLSLLDDVKALAADFVAGKNDGCSSTNLPKQDFNAWPSLQQQLFLQTLLDAADSSGPLRMTTLDALEDLYGLTSKKNSELRFKWCKLCLKSGRTQILRTVADFLVSQGRMKFTRPLYRCLMDTPAAGGQELALGTFAANKDIYHPICRKMVASDMAKAMDRKKEAASSEEYRAGLSFGLGVAAAVAVVALVAKARS